jgi:hypothetical protein
MCFLRKRSVNVTAATNVFLRENEVSAATDLKSPHCYKSIPFDHGE